MELEKIIEVLCDIMKYCNEKGVDFEEDEHLNNAICVLSDEKYNILRRNGKTDLEIEEINKYIIRGQYTLAIMEMEEEKI